jgi:hypothetical protein
MDGAFDKPRQRLGVAPLDLLESGQGDVAHESGLSRFLSEVCYCCVNSCTELLQALRFIMHPAPDYARKAQVREAPQPFANQIKSSETSESAAKSLA